MYILLCPIILSKYSNLKQGGVKILGIWDQSYISQSKEVCVWWLGLASDFPVAFAICMIMCLTYILGM